MKKQKRVFGLKFECNNKNLALDGCKIEVVFDGSTEEDDSYESQISYEDPDLIEEDSDDA